MRESSALHGSGMSWREFNAGRGRAHVECEDVVCSSRCAARNAIAVPVCFFHFPGNDDGFRLFPFYSQTGADRRASKERGAGKGYQAGLKKCDIWQQRPSVRAHLPFLLFLFLVRRAFFASRGTASFFASVGESQVSKALAFRSGCPAGLSARPCRPHPATRPRHPPSRQGKPKG